jgi:2-amino-4-hydroxy-6-hydroxymethyldihydropteridine diphosphokinase
LALGTNLGEREKNLEFARAALAPEVKIVEESPIYETPPWGYTEQPKFLNQVVKAETNLSPEALLSYLKEIESQLGRRQTIRYGPRVIDLDILFYDDVVLSQSGLTIPHPHLHKRAFVLVPLADLAPDMQHPILNQSVSEILEEVDQEGVEYF